MEHSNIIESGGFYFIHNFDSGNLGHVERIPTDMIAPGLNHKTNSVETPDYEFNLWTRPDCAGTEFENSNRTWFYFGIQASKPNALVRLNLINLNKQGKMYNQGMAPVTRTLPGKPQWERIRDRPVHSTDDNTFTLSFKYRTSENLKATTFFAFTYPFSFAELQIALNSIDLKMLPLPPPQTPDDIYYYRECLIYSLEGRRVDLLTITSHHGITTGREERLKNLFPDNQERPFKFQNKKIIFVSARVHPGETPSSFVFNGFLNLLLNRSDPIAIQLRKLYVFKLIPFLNPDGVARGHYRTDTRGVNLNRVYLNPSLDLHPTVYASRALIRYYHYGCEKEDICEDSKSVSIARSMQNVSENEVSETKKKKSTASTSFRSNDYLRREKPGKSLSTNKSSTTIKRPSNSLETNKKEAVTLGRDATNLAEHVLDMKLQEQSAQTSDASSRISVTNNTENSSLLNDNVLRSCLGSNVHLSTSEEMQMQMQGSNPLRSLRDTLKNSISLLMGSNSSVGDSTVSAPESGVSCLKMGWCAACRRSVRRLEDASPGFSALVPGYSDNMMRSDSPTFCTIDEYREHQRHQFDDFERKLLEEAAAEKGGVYFCTNCFKRYIITDSNEEVKVRDGMCPLPGEEQAPATPDATGDCAPPSPPPAPPSPAHKEEKPKLTNVQKAVKKKPSVVAPLRQSSVLPPKELDSNLYLYIDLHGHASKKGIFMYGNHFEDMESSVECMLLPRIMSLNNLHFHFSSCNFTERNMYLKDRRDGMSREGSGRVAVLKATGLVRSYTLECNYNTGRLVNVLPPAVRDAAPPSAAAPPLPPKYTPHIFEEVRLRGKNLEVYEEIDPYQVGRSLGASILDLTGAHPNSRIPCSEHRTLPAVREWLRSHARAFRPMLTMSRLRPKTSSPTRVPLYGRSKGKITEERKENTYAGAKSDTERKRTSPVLVQRSGHDMAMNMKFAKKNEPVKSTSRTRYLVENESKTKLITAKRRTNVLSIRKPNASKTQTGGIVKAKLSRRSADDTESSRGGAAGKLGKRSFARAARAVTRAESRRALASSSSDELAGAGWEPAAGAPAALAALAAPPHLKKLRLKTAL